MTKAELIRMLMEKVGNISQKEASLVVNTLFKGIQEGLKAGGRVELRGFGVFSVRSRGRRIGRNPRTGETVEVPAKVVPCFKPAKALRTKLSKKKVF